MFLIFLIALIFFALIGVLVVGLINKMLNSMSKDDAKTDVDIKDIYKNEKIQIGRINYTDIDRRSNYHQYLGDRDE